MNHQGQRPGIAGLLLNKKYWMLYFLFVALISVAGLIYLGRVTYADAPPLADFVSPSGEVVVPRNEVQRGRDVFLRRGLMGYGSFWGDGAERGPDFIADALRQATLAMQAFHEARDAGAPTEYDQDAIVARATRELRHNGWDGAKFIQHSG